MLCCENQEALPGNSAIFVKIIPDKADIITLIDTHSDIMSDAGIYKAELGTAPYSIY